MHEQMLQTRLMRFVDDLADETTRARLHEIGAAYDWDTVGSA